MVKWVELKTNWVFVYVPYKGYVLKYIFVELIFSNFFIGNVVPSLPLNPHVLLLLSFCQTWRSTWSAPSPSVSQTSKCHWMTSTGRSLMDSVGQQEVCVCVCVRATICSRTVLNEIIIYLSCVGKGWLHLLTSCFQVVTTRVMWMCWPPLYRSWPPWRERPRPPSSTWATSPTRYSRPSEDTYKHTYACLVKSSSQLLHYLVYAFWCKPLHSQTRIHSERVPRPYTTVCGIPFVDSFKHAYQLYSS